MVALGRSPIPLYFQIASDLRRQIESGLLAPQSQLPNEKDLARRYEVSLVTVRGAMRLLLDDGLVVRQPGKGTFVAAAQTEHLVWSMGSLDDLVAMGLKSTMRLLSQQTIAAPAWVCQKLGLPAGDRAHHVRTLREADGQPFMLTDQYHETSLARSIRKSDFTRPAARSRLVIEIVAERCGFAIGSVQQTMSAEKAERDVADLLGTCEGDPLLVVERDFYATDGRLIQTGRAHYRTDRYRYSITADQRSAASGRGRTQPLLRRELAREDL